MLSASLPSHSAQMGLGAVLTAPESPDTHHRVLCPTKGSAGESWTGQPLGLDLELLSSSEH